MSHVTEAQRAVLDGRAPTLPGPPITDPKTGKLKTGDPVPITDPALLKHYRLEAVWAQLHDDAEAAFGGDPTQFFGPHGETCLKALDGADPAASCQDLLTTGRSMITKAGGKLPEPEPQPQSTPQPEPRQEAEAETEPPHES